jgi:hypothetical protein
MNQPAFRDRASVSLSARIVSIGHGPGPAAGRSLLEFRAQLEQAE